MFCSFLSILSLEWESLTINAGWYGPGWKSAAVVVVDERAKKHELKREQMGVIC